MLTYNTGDVFAGGSVKRDWVLTISTSEFIVLSLMYILSAAESGVVLRATSDHRFRKTTAENFLLGPDIRIAVDNIFFRDHSRL